MYMYLCISWTYSTMGYNFNHADADDDHYDVTILYAQKN